jgi:hypothetical protein
MPPEDKSDKKQEPKQTWNCNPSSPSSEGVTPPNERASGRKKQGLALAALNRIQSHGQPVLQQVVEAAAARILRSGDVDGMAVLESMLAAEGRPDDLAIVSAVLEAVS